MDRECRRGNTASILLSLMLAAVCFAVGRWFSMRDHEVKVILPEIKIPDINVTMPEKVQTEVHTRMHLVFTSGSSNFVADDQTGIVYNYFIGIDNRWHRIPID